MTRGVKLLVAGATAFGAVVFVTLIKERVPAIGTTDSFVLDFIAVAIAAWLGGWVGGLLATLLVCAAFLWLGGDELSAVHTLRVTLFVLEGAALTFVIHRLKRGEAKLVRARDRVDDSRALLDNVIETAPSAIVATEPDGSLFLFNRAAERLTGFSRSEVIGKPLLELFVPPEWQEEVASRFREPVPEVLREPHRNPWRTKEGGERLIEWRCVVMPGARGNRIIGVGVDVTDVRELEQERARLTVAERQAREIAEDAAAAKDRFLATVSHELRGPLTAILGWTQLLITSADDEVILKRGLEAIEDNARTQAKLVNDLLDYTRIAAGKVELNRAPVRVDDVVLSVVNSFMPEVERKHLELRLETTAANATVEADELRLRQVFMNVLQNAIRYTDSGWIDVRSEISNGSVRVAIRDTGRGIPAELLPRIFERFTQESHDGEGSAGAGLGLAIAKELISLHGGRVEAQSDGPGKGATFFIELPATA